MAYRPHHANAHGQLPSGKRRNVNILKALIPVSCIGALVAVAVFTTASSAAPRASSTPNAAGSIAAAPAHVQMATGHSGYGSTVQATLPKPATVGNLLVAYVVSSDTGPVSITDSRGDAYASVVTPNTSSRYYGSSVLYAKNLKGGATTLTATFSRSVRFAVLDVHEYSGLDPVSPVDGTSAATGRRGTLDSGPVQARAGDLIFAAGTSIGTIVSGGPGYTVRSRSGGRITEDDIAGTAGTFNATAVHGRGSWVMQAVAFKASASSGDVPPPPPTTSSAPPTTSHPAPSTSAAPTTTAPHTTSAPPPPPTTTTATTKASAPPPAPSTGSSPLPAFPDASCTGVPAGTSLTTHNGSITVSTPGTVIDGLDVHGCVQIETTGVVIRNSRISCTGGYVVYGHTNASFRIEDSEVDCANTNGTAIGDTNITVLRVDVHGCENGFDADQNVDIEDSYIHDLYQSAVAHTDGLQSAIGSNLTLNHNTFYANDGTSAININNNASGPRSSNTIVSNNLLAGGAFSLYCPIPSTQNFRVVDNHFSTKFYPKVGAYGPWTDCSGESLSGNVYQQSGAPVPAG